MYARVKVEGFRIAVELDVLMQGQGSVQGCKSRPYYSLIEKFQTSSTCKV